MKKIVLAGSTSGVGLGFIESQIEKDVSITCLYRDESKLDKLKERFADYLDKLSFVKLDLSDVPNIESTIKAQISSEKRFDAFVFCVGKANLTRLKKATYEKALDVMNVNYFSFLELVRLFVNNFKSKDGVFKIVAISSQAAKTTGSHNVLYGASKAALNSFVRTTAKEFAKSDVLINSIAPSYIDTEMINNIRRAYTPEEFEKYIKAVQCLGLIPVKEIASEIDYLLWTSNFVTGTVRIINAGSVLY